MVKGKKRIGNAKIAVGYIRVSTSEQHLGPEAQRKALEAWAKREGVHLAAVFEDIGVSGKAPVEKRAGLMAAIDGLMAHGAGVLVAAKRDRLARDTLVSGMISALARSAGARAISVDDKDDDDDLMATLRRGIEDLFAQHERLVIRARTRAALAVKKARNERTGDIPLGHKLAEDGVHLAVDDAESAALARILELRAQQLSIRAIADRLNEERVPCRGQRWHRTTVDRVLRRQAV